MAVKVALSNEALAKKIIEMPEFSDSDKGHVAVVVQWVRDKIAAGKGREFFDASLAKAEETGDALRVRGGKVALEAFRKINGEKPDADDVHHAMKKVEPLPAERDIRSEILALMPVYIWLDSGVEEKYAKEIYNVLDYIIDVGKGRLDGLKIVVKESVFADNCVQNAFDEKDNKTDVVELIKGIILETKKEHLRTKMQHPFIICVISKNLYFPKQGLGFLFGYSGYNQSIVSQLGIKRFGEKDEIYDPITGKMGDSGPIAFRAIVIHELTHQFVLHALSSKNWERMEKGSIGWHCKKTDCVFGQVAVAGRPSLYNETKAAVERIRKHGGGYLCADCEEHVKEAQENIYKNVELDYSSKFNTNMERMENAIADYEKNELFSPVSALCISGKGDIFETYGRYDEALEMYEKAEAWGRKSGLLFKLGRYEEALEAQNKLLELRPNPENLKQKGAILNKIGRNTEALSVLDKVLDRFPDHGEALHMKGIVLAELGRKDESDECLKRASEFGLEDEKTQE